MDTDDVLHAISALPDPLHPSTQMARRAAAEIEQLRTALLPFVLSHNIAKRTLGPFADVGHLDAIAKQYFKFSDLGHAAKVYGEVKD
ncbi:hypothetical protein [Roseibium sp. Sym1]|uniref:hypothetical protein n=1 Tax=Roseibium sp. Sym1 TaxID=3016006 RepID=UPI0022B5917C|nr:hypothetical protein [Roseibium sp. Sym1]